MNADGQLVRFNLINYRCRPGIMFTLHENVASNAPAVAAIEAALSAWSQRLGVDIKLERLPNVQPVTVNNPAATDRSVIYFDASWTRGMATAIKPGFVMSTIPGDAIQKERAVLFDTDIRMGTSIIDGSSSYTWDYNLSGDTPANKASFYDGFLHEIGHTLGLGHIIDRVDGEKELMCPTQSPARVAANRPTLTSSGGSSALGAVNIVNVSKTTTWFPLNPAGQQIHTITYLGAYFA